ncbi:guanine nucleotide-binding protein-like 3 homolog [Neocloeon triangulifer]|uniref:guanine nucleotide-binding protein-like 3 homolog n=1 Tax=Neocloeon triangulifer TaxID=2078957 RepID=UPI00286F972B|nr:guanine nucleotide-binding protein-like 3 homolog [Neocloeon triangulifer]
MAKLCLKKASKRIQASKRYKIEKRVKEHNKKLKKEAKKRDNKVNRKPVQIPNICPFKEKIIAEVEALKALQEKEKEAKREQMREERSKQKEILAKGGLEGLVNSAEQRNSKHETETNEHTDFPGIFTDTSVKAFYKEFKKVLNNADVILEVLDARDPLGTRCPTVEKEVVEGAGKKLVIVLNKADLVPREILNQWLKYLRRSFPTVPFKASTQQQGQKLSTGGGRKRKMVSTLTQAEMEGSPCVGAELLMSLLANYCRNKDIKTAITVGIVGLPNVGKSSIINSLKRAKACNVGALPGITKTMQQVQLDSRVKLLDSPGIVFATGDMSDASIALKNALRLDNLQDFFKPAEAILQRANKDQLKSIYNIDDDFTSADHFLALMAKAMGRYKKGGVPDARAAARTLIHDWNTGKIKYYVLPPEETDEDVHISSAIVKELAEEFDINQIASVEKTTMNNLGKLAPDSAMPVTSDGPVTAVFPDLSKIATETEVQMAEVDEEEDEDFEDMEENDEPKELIAKRVRVVATKKRRKGKAGAKGEKADPTMELEGNLKVGKLKKMQFKKAKKDKKRQARLSNKME